ncbi:MAG: hypothetical protein AAFX79_09280 [Planctomycetota bacterium]
MPIKDHCGLACADAEEELPPFWVHMVGSDGVRIADIPDRGRYVHIQVDPHIAVLAITQARMIGKRNPELAFGYDHPEGVFTEDGELANAEEFAGLTCSTFVLAVLDSVAIRLMDYATVAEKTDPQERAEDSAMLEKLAVNAPTPEKAEALRRRSRVRPIRVRPIEVMAAAASHEGEEACDYQTATEIGRDLESHFE